jgi:predicted ArsR family transcriptional regulator
MQDEYEGLPFAEAEQRLRDEIEAHRQAMGPLGRRRAELVAAEVARRGPGGARDVAEEMGLSEPAVRRLMREARLQTESSDQQSGAGRS